MVALFGHFNVTVSSSLRHFSSVHFHSTTIYKDLDLDVHLHLHQGADSVLTGQ